MFGISSEKFQPKSQEVSLTAEEAKSLDFGAIPEGWLQDKSSSQPASKSVAPTKKIEQSQITKANTGMFLGKEQRAQYVNIPTDVPQLSQMWYSVPKQSNLSEKNSWIDDMFKKAGSMGISSAFHCERPIGSDKVHEYVIFSTDRNAIKNLAEGNFKEFPQWLERQKFQDTGIVLLDKLVIDVTDIDRHNYFAKNSYIMRYVQNMAIIKRAFENEGYPVPDHVSRYVVSSIWELDQMRANPSVPENLRERYNQTYKDAVADYAQSYADKYKLEIVPHRGKHEVKETYFRDNHIPVVWDVVDENLWKFIQQELKDEKYPDFIYFKPDKAYLKTKNLAKEFEKLTKGKNFEDQNFWSQDTGKTKYHICFPLAQQDMFYNMMNAYNTRTFESKVPLEELKQKSNQPLQLIYIHSYDMTNWSKLCKAGNVEWALNDGTYGDCKITPDSALEELPILYRTEDMKTVSHIVNRLSREMREYVPMSDVSEKEKTDRALKAIHKASKQIDEKQAKQKRGWDLDI